MMLATHADVDYPHIDWKCVECGEVYCSAGMPDDNRCLDGHDADWRPEDDQMREYIDILESLDVGDGVLFAGIGPAPLMAPIEEVGDSHVVTEGIDSPRRTIRWDSDELEIEQAKTDDDYQMWDRVYHIDTVEVLASA